MLNGPTQYLTRQTLPVACIKLFLAVFAIPLLPSTSSFSSSLLALGGMLAHNMVSAMSSEVADRLTAAALLV